MAANKYMSQVGGKLKEVTASVTSTPNALVAADSTGRIDATMMPVGIGAEIITGIASEAISAGAFVNEYNNSGVVTFRNADCTTNGKKAIGFVLAAVASGGIASVYTLSQTNTQLSGLTIGADYFLSTIGTISLSQPVPPTGVLSQLLGQAISTTSLIFSNLLTIELAV